MTDQSVAVPMRHYCTLFDSHYLLKGLAMYQSLEQHGGNFRLYILCMDDTAYDLLRRLALPHARLIRLGDFEDADLRAVKPERTVAEYCWTCAPCLPVYVFERHAEVEFITYLDADLLFYSSLEPVYDEIGGASSVIVEHRFSPRFLPAMVNGRYNVQWVSFRRDAAGLETLNWWRNKCIEWCFYRVEEERMGDQKYLNCWTTKFKGVHELQHVGAGTAPWNYANYNIHEQDGRVWIDNVPLVFYHFHGYRILADGKSIPMPSVYTEGEEFPALIYARYDQAIAHALATVRSIAPEFALGIDVSATQLRCIHTTKKVSASSPKKQKYHIRLLRWLLQGIGKA